MIVPGIDDAFPAAFKAMCTRLKVDPFDLLGVAANESGLRPDAWNHDGNASGFWQLMPDTARQLGWPLADCIAGLPQFRSLSASGQLRWFEKYFAPHTGQLVNRAACYVSTFLPADIGLAGDPDAVLVDKNGRRGWAYSSNASFDENHDLRIQVRELEDAIQRNARGPRWDALVVALGGELAAAPPPVPFDLGTTLGLQEALGRLGYEHGPDDGLVGPATRGALRRFQAEHGLAPDSIPGPRTRAALVAALATAA